MTSPGASRPPGLGRCEHWGSAWREPLGQSETGSPSLLLFKINIEKRVARLPSTGPWLSVASSWQAKMGI